MTRTLIVMARAPQLGRGKTRIARDAGRLAALRFNRQLQARTLRFANDNRWRTVLAVTPPAAARLHLPGIWPLEVVRVAQGSGDLGDRLARVMKRVRGPLAVIGTDSPDVTPKDIADAFHALGRTRVSIGPARDGGFWILAARRSVDVIGAFAGVRWSTPDTLSDVIARLKTTVAHLRTLDDIDTLDDWCAWRARQSYRRVDRAAS